MFRKVMASFIVVMSLFPQISMAHQTKVVVKKINPNMAIKDALSKTSGNCGIIEQDGNHYRVCPYRVTPKLQSQIRSAIDKL